MSECRFVARDLPRVIPGRHDDDCPDYGACDGCLPCPEAHCRVCGRVHGDGACAECLAVVRSDLRDIGRMCDALPEETEHRGVESEAAMLWGPSADPEARGHLEASVLAGRVSPEYLEHADDELHPLFVTETWAMVWRDALEHDEPQERATVAGTLAYLDRQLTYMGGYEHVPFEDFARDVRRCRAHLEAVLHDGEQVDTGAPCMSCRVPLRRVWGGEELPWFYRDGSRPLAGEDGWACARCKEWRSNTDYRLNVANLHREKADWLTDQEMQIRTGVKAGTIRVWAKRGGVASKRDQGRTVYRVADVEKRVAS